jgi:hypothetical protein
MAKAVGAASKKTNAKMDADNSNRTFIFILFSIRKK